MGVINYHNILKKILLELAGLSTKIYNKALKYIYYDLNFLEKYDSKFKAANELYHRILYIIIF